MGALYVQEKQTATIQSPEQVNWDKIETIKQKAREALDARELARQQADDLERQRLEEISRLRLENFKKLMRNEIGDLFDEFTVTTDELRESLLIAFGLCKTTRIAFRLGLPDHNPVHVIVSYGKIVAPHYDGTVHPEIQSKPEFVPNDVPSFVPGESKFIIYPNPEFHRKMAGRVKVVKRVGTELNGHGIPISDAPKAKGFDDIGEALVAAEEMHKAYADPTSTLGQYMQKIEAESFAEDEAKAQQMLKDEQAKHPGIITLKDQLESCFTLGRKFKEEQL